MLNLVALQGRLTHRPELKTTTSGLDVVSFSLAVQRDKDNTDFIDCVAWRETAKFISQYFEKGSQIIVSGNLRTRSYETKDGGKRKAVEVLCNKADFCGGKSDHPTGQSEQPTGQPETQHFEEVKDDDELPF